MEAEAIAAAAVILIIKQFSEGYFQAAGEKAFKQVEKIYLKVKEKFAGDSYSEQTLARLEEKPEDPSRKAAFEGLLAEKITADSAFAQELQDLMDSVEHGAITQLTASGEGSVVVKGNINGVNIITGNSNMVGSGITGTVNYGFSTIESSAQISDTSQRKVGTSLAAYTALLGEIKTLLEVTGGDEDTVEILKGDIKFIEMQIVNGEPNKSIILSRLEAITKSLPLLTGGKEMGDKVHEAIQITEKIF